MQSIQLNTEDAQNFTQYGLQYLGFLSTLDSLKSPPPSYQKPAIDVVAEFRNTSSQVASGSLTS